MQFEPPEIVHQSWCFLLLLLLLVVVMVLLLLPLLLVLVRVLSLLVLVLTGWALSRACHVQARSVTLQGVARFAARPASQSRHLRARIGWPH